MLNGGSLGGGAQGVFTWRLKTGGDWDLQMRRGSPGVPDPCG